ncbi:DUF6174 domain-containing protein [Phytohabitans houttuyneae]|uniref:DUF6174 domain-containing protein n=1 Tax=Phytohabitans houttuyneae TaxID=1076126 RepID=UPI001565547D|nr:DUF6174 domain-containing protein [Phytohabitans houttuyneae]
MRITVGLLAAMSLAACGEATHTIEAAPVWQEPSHYTYVLESSCGERLLIGRFRITVDGGKVTKAEGLDEPGQRALQGKSESPPTLGQLLEQVRTARRANAHKAELTTDPTDGHPTKITIDPIENAIDDESCYAITEYRA